MYLVISPFKEAPSCGVQLTPEGVLEGEVLDGWLGERGRPHGLAVP